MIDLILMFEIMTNELLIDRRVIVKNSNLKNLEFDDLSIERLKMQLIY